MRGTPALSWISSGCQLRLSRSHYFNFGENGVAATTPGEPKVPPDEREKMIETTGKRFSYAILAWAIRLALLLGISNPQLFFNANTLLFFLMISEVFGFGYQIVQFRRGA
jgi:hypothetical protein